MEAVRELALQEGKTISEMVNGLLAEGVQRRAHRETPKVFELPSFSMGKPRIDLADRDALEAAMES